MAEDMTALLPPLRTKVITLPAADVAREVILPKWARRISFRSTTDPMKYSSEGTDGAAISADYMTVGGDILHTVSLDRTGRAGVDVDTPSIYFATAAGGTVLRLVLEMSAG
jgi:hypothetical protein